jgi:hypothetical protein
MIGDEEIFAEDRHQARDQTKRMLIYHHPSCAWTLPYKDQSSLSGISTKNILPVGF